MMRAQHGEAPGAASVLCVVSCPKCSWSLAHTQGELFKNKPCPDPLPDKIGISTGEPGVVGFGGLF